MKTGYIVFAHGSRVEKANEQVRTVASRMAVSGGLELVEAAFLERAQPDLVAAIGRLVNGGAERVVVIPYFLTAGRHVAVDLPRIAEEASSIYQRVRIDIAATMGGHPALEEILLDRARQVDA